MFFLFQLFCGDRMSDRLLYIILPNLFRFGTHLSYIFLQLYWATLLGLWITMTAYSEVIFPITICHDLDSPSQIVFLVVVELVVPDQAPGPTMRGHYIMPW
jgi:hypothetical protein